jgi:uroporphyrinogen-III synthase
MDIKNILVSQPYPSSERSPYFDIQRKFGVNLTFKPFIHVESLTPTEFRAQKISLSNFTAIVFTSKTAVEHFFKLAEELRAKPNEDMQYFCLSETIALYLQKFIVFRKRKVHHSKVGKIEDLALVMKKHNTEKFLMPVADVRKEEIPAFTKAKLKVTPVVMYRTVSSEVSPEEIASYDMLVFFTPAGIQSLYDNDPDYQQGDQRICLFGPQTAKAAEERGLRIDAKGPTPELPSMAGVLMKYLNDLK